MSESLKKTYVIGRYYFTTLFKKEAEASFLADILKKPYIMEKAFEYALGDFSPEVVDNISLMRGTFGRVRKGQLADVYDHSRKEFKKQVLPELVDKKIEFVIDHQSHLIFIEDDAIIRPDAFFRKFKKVYTQASAMSGFEIDFIVVERDFYSAIQKWNRVDTISVSKLRPSNPSSLDDFAEVEALLKETGSTNTNLEFRAPKEEMAAAGNRDGRGLNYESKLIKQSLALSHHGYGEVRLEGESGGERVKIETKNFLRRITIDFSAEGALERIIQEIKIINQGEVNE